MEILSYADARWFLQNGRHVDATSISNHIRHQLLDDEDIKQEGSELVYREIR